MKIKLAILVGGNSIERAVSFQSEKEILKNIDREKYDIEVIEITENQSSDWIASLIENKPDIVLSALHGGSGENGAVQGLLECLGIKYIGSKVLASSLCMDKYISKLIMRYNNIPVAEDIFIKKDEQLYLYKEKINEVGYPVIVKPNGGGSSIGISIAENYEQLEEAVSVVKSFNDDILIEKYIIGREITCAVVKNKDEMEVLAVLDIITTNKFYDYSAKYENDFTKIEFTKLPEFLQTMIKEIAKKTFSVLKCEGYGIVDMIVQQEQVFVIEVNTLPGLTKNSLIPKAAAVMGIGFSDFLDRLIEYELNME